MKRYFYDDPLAAAYMAKYHGMRFVFICANKTERDMRESEILLPLLEYDSYCKETFANLSPRDGAICKYPVHPDSLPLLEPQPLDLILDGNGEYQIVNYNAGLFAERHGFEKIIQRGGISFLWPKTKEGEK